MIEGEEQVVHSTSEFRVAQVEPFWSGDIYVNWAVIHNQYETREALTQNLVDALVICERCQEAMDNKVYLRTTRKDQQGQSNMDEILKQIESGDAQVLNFPSDSSNSDDDDDPTMN